MLLRLAATMHIVALAAGITTAQTNDSKPVTEEGGRVNWRAPNVSNSANPRVLNSAGPAESGASQIPADVDRPDELVTPASAASAVSTAATDVGSGITRTGITELNEMPIRISSSNVSTPFAAK